MFHDRYAKTNRPRTDPESKGAPCLAGKIKPQIETAAAVAHEQKPGGESARRDR